MKPGNRRSAFTLLEVLLASLIAILLLSALYFAMDMTVRQTQASRESMDVENLSRGVFTRINLDLSASLGPLPPKSGGNAASSASTANASAAAAATSTADPTAAVATGTGTTASSPDTATATPASTDPTTAAAPSAADISFQAGIKGDDKQLTVFASRLPGTLTSGQGLSQPADLNNPSPSDLVRVTYWLSQNGGLCRQERPWVTADGVRDSADPDLSDEAGDLLVPEVKDVTFEYFDGSSWQSSWDGTAMSPDSVAPIGPPRAIRVTLNFSFPSTKTGGTPYEPTAVTVIPIRAAPGTYTPVMITPSTDAGTTTPDTGTAASGANAATTNNGSGASGSGATGSGATGAAGATSGAKATGSSAMPSTATKSSSAPATATPSSTGSKSTGSSMPATSTPATSTPATSSGGKGGK